MRYLPCATNFRGEATSVPDRVVSFWTKVDNCVVPIGFGYVVAGGILLCRHQAKGDKSMEELQAAGFPLYVGRAELSVSTIDHLHPFRLGEVVAPPKVKAAHEISRDFAFMKSDIASKLGFKTRSLQFGFRNNAAFETFHYRYDDGKLAFVLIRNVGSLTGPLDSVKGVYCHGVDTKPGDSGSPLLTVGTGEIVGIRCGILTNDESLITHRLAIGSRQIYSHMRKARMIAGKKGGILESCLLPQIDVDVYVKCSKKPAPAEGGQGEAKRLKVPIPRVCGVQVEVTAARVVTSGPAPSNTSSTAPATGLGVTADPQCNSQPAVPHVLEYAAYSEQLERYRRGEVTGAYIEAMWGEQVWDLMQAQMEIEQMEQDSVPQGHGQGLADGDARGGEEHIQGEVDANENVQGVQSANGLPASLTSTNNEGS